MNIVDGLKIEMIKVKRSKFFLFQFIVIIGSIMMLNGYYFLYSNRSSDLDRMKMIYECLGAFLPIYSTINVAFLLKIEEQLSSMYGILGVQHRSKIMAPIFIISWMGYAFQVIFQTLSLLIIGTRSADVITMLFRLSVGIIIIGIFFFVWHLFLHLKLGVGISVFGGVFEMLQMIIYSNIKLQHGFKYLPFAWFMEWKADVMNCIVRENTFFWVNCFLIIVFLIFAFFMWFKNWEGKKNYAD